MARIMLKHLGEDFLHFCISNNVPCNDVTIRAGEDSCNVRCVGEGRTGQVAICLGAGVFSDLLEKSVDDWSYKGKWDKFKEEAGERFINETYLGSIDFKFWERDAR